ncbi:MAG: hypothetical protein LBD09_01920 [Treponema sp.]|jgi:hypothetical protein|nr:hypothetical protein [Treponema sp.]
MKRFSRDSPDLYALVENLPPDDPAWNLLDAFDAVTNGMENPEAIKQARRLTDPALEGWKYLVEAIAALYGGNPGECRRAAEAIPGGSAPESLKPLFRAWLIRLGGGGGGNEALFKTLSGCPAAAELFGRLVIEPHPLCLQAEQAEEALRQGLEEQFCLLASRMLCALRETSPPLAFRYGLYCLYLVNDSSSPGDDFFSLLRKSLGDADAFCALGFALAGRDNEAAAAALRRALENIPAGAGSFLREENAGPVRVLLELLGPLRGDSAAGRTGPERPGKRRRAPAQPAQPDLFESRELSENRENQNTETETETKTPKTPENQTGELLAALKKNLSPGGFAFMERALLTPPSFDELARELPPALRYLGPGCWIKAIKDSSGPV